jgi:hypothetical protein
MLGEDRVLRGGGEGRLTERRHWNGTDRVGVGGIRCAGDMR